MNYKNRITRHQEKFKVNFARTKRYQDSTIPALQRILNTDDLTKKNILRSFGR